MEATSEKGRTPRLIEICCGRFGIQAFNVVSIMGASVSFYWKKILLKVEEKYPGLGRRWRPGNWTKLEV
jgi:hypothetical protein